MIKFIKTFSDVPNGFIEDFFDISKEEYYADEFAIDLKIVANWLEVRKDSLKTILITNFEKNYDYVIEMEKKFHRTGATLKENIFLTPDTFKELCMLSQTKKAKEVRRYYLSIEKLIKKYYTEIQDKLYSEIDMLKINQKPKINIKGGVIYILEALNTNTTLYKIGKSWDIRNRLNTYNSGNANDIEPIFVIKVDDIDSVESCVKNAIKRFQYRKYKEIYEINLDILKQVMYSCDEFAGKINKLIDENDDLSDIDENNLYMAIHKD